MSLNVGSISARFGLDPAEFLEKMRGVSGSTKFFSDEMKRSMRETSRQGTESFRLIDEAIGIHISKPLTRLLTHEFPGFAKGLQAVLGIGAVGALGAVGFEAFEKVSKSIEKAQRAQEAMRAATQNVNAVFAEEISAYKEKDKAITASTEKVNKLIEAQMKQTKAAEEASGPWTHLLASFGEFATKASSFQSTMDTSQINKQLGEFKQKYDMAALADQTNRTHTAMQLLTAEIERAKNAEHELTSQAVAGHSWYSPGSGVSWDTVAAAKAYLDQLKQIQAVQTATTVGVRAEEAKEKARKTAESIASFYREIGGASAKIAPDIDPIHKLEGEITTARLKAVADFDEMRKAGASALNLDHALAALGRLEALQDRVLANAKATAAVAQAQALLPATIAPTGRAPTFAPPTAMPTLGAGGMAGAQFDAFAKDDVAKQQMAKRVYEEALTPLEKYTLGVRELDQLVHDHLIDDTTKAAGMAELDQQMVKAASSAHKLQEEMQKLLEKSNDAGAGLKAYAMQLQLNAEENGKVVYDVLTSATKSGEEDAAKSLMDILEEQRGGHRALIHELEAMWSGYFKNIATMGMKNMMDRALAPLGKAIGGAGTNPSAGDSTKSGSAVPSGLLGWLMPKAASTTGAGGTASLSAAGTMLTHAGTELLSAAMALRASAGVAGGGASAGGGGSPFGDITELGGAIPFYASGGDATPGSSFISGEAGAERVDLDRSGGAHITPLGMKEGGDTHIYNDFSGSVMTDDLMRRAEGMAAIHANIRVSEGRMLSAIPAMQREIVLRKRS